MLKKIRRFTALFLLAAAAQAQDTESSVSVPDRNQIFFHPVITVISLAAEQLPAVFVLTYERHLASGGASFIFQPQLALGSQKVEDTKVTQLSLANALGLRKYFNGTTRGMYIQGSGVAAFGTLDAEQEGTSNTGKANMNAFGALGYLGYKWSNVFLDVGAGFQVVDATLKLSDGSEVDVNASGLAIDFNLGFGF
jgi:hypothetical protein